MPSKWQECNKKLHDLIGQAGRNYYDRIGLVVTMLRDCKSEIEEQFGGDEPKFLKAMEEKFFHDLCGTLSIQQLIEVYHFFPTVEEWQAKKWKLMVLWAEVEESKRQENGQERETEPSVVKRPTAAQVREWQETAERVEQIQRQNAKKDDIISNLQAENNELRARVASLEGELREARRMIDRLMEKSEAA